MVLPDLPFNEQLITLAGAVRNGSTDHVRRDEPDALDGNGEPEPRDFGRNFCGG